LQILELDLDIDSLAAIRLDPHVKDAGFVPDNLGDKSLVFKDFNQRYRFQAFLTQYGVKEGQALLLIAFFAHEFQKKVVIQRVKAFHTLIILYNSKLRVKFSQKLARESVYQFL
jgi:hypothetical protein